MTFFGKYPRYILSVVCTILPIIIILLTYKLVRITDYEVVVTEYIDETSQRTETLPFSHISTPYMSGGHSTIRGSFAVDPLEPEEKIHFYVPSLFGHLIVSSNDEILLNNHDDKQFPFLNIAVGASFSTPSAPSSSTTIEFSLIDNESPFRGLSQVYVGTAEQMLKAERRRNFYDIFLRDVYWGAEAIAIITLVTIFALARTREHISPSLTILVYLFLTQTPGVLLKYLDITAFIQHINSFAFIAILAIVRFERQILLQKGEKARPKELSIALSMATIALFLCTYYPPVARSFHLFITFPCFLVSLFLVAVRSIKNTFISGRIDVAVLAIGTSVTSLALAHDMLARTGYLQTATYVTGTATLCFFICAVFLLLSYAQRSNQMLLNQQKTLDKTLNEQSDELEAQFAIQAELQEQNAIASENRRITRDLHDGVLTYLSIIQSLSESLKGSTDKDINALAKNAMREIRVIIDFEAFDQNSIFLTLSSLRNQIVGPLQNTGIDVDWDLLPLLDQSIIDPIHALDLFRIIQEAIHNAVNRAMCRSLAVYAELDTIGNKICIYVVNKGGISLEPNSLEGNGIRNMRRRAASMGATFCLTTISGGAELVLSFESEETTI